MVWLRDLWADNKLLFSGAAIVILIAFSLIKLTSGDMQSEEDAAKIREGLGVMSASETAEAMARAQQMSRSIPSAAQIQRRMEQLQQLMRRIGALTQAGRFEEADQLIDAALDLTEPTASPVDK